MSKKNRQSTRKAAHAFDIKREELAKVSKRKKKAALAVAATSPGKPANVKPSDAKRAEAKPAVRHKQHKAIKVRKGMKIRGIKVVDSESKKKVLDILKKEQAMKIMDVDAPTAEEVPSYEEAMES